MIGDVWLLATCKVTKVASRTVDLFRPQLLEGLGVELTEVELEDAATRIQKWQASRLLLQGFLRWL